MFIINLDTLMDTLQNIEPETIVNALKNFVFDIMGPTFPIINVLLIVVVGILGTMLRGRLKVRFQKILVQAVGLVAILFGFCGAWDGFFVLQDGQIETTGTLLVLFSLLVGCLFGEAMNVEKGLDILGGCFKQITEKSEQEEAAKAKTTQPAKKKEKSEAIPYITSPNTPVEVTKPLVYNMPSARSGKLFEDGFAIATLFCVLGALAVSGHIVDRTVDGSISLLIKVLVDAVVIFTLATVYGSGVIFASIPVLIVEGLVMVISALLGTLVTPTLVSQLTLIASVVLIVVGINLCFGKKLRAANMVPSLLIPVLYGGIMLLVNKLIGE